jgi:hypothetical protein
MERYKKNEAIKVNYIALKKTVGLTDVEMQVFNPADVLVSTFTMTEVVAGSGENALSLYRASFTPTTDGQWRIRIQSATNLDDISKVFEIGNYKLDDVKDQLDTVEGKVDIIDGNVTSIKGTVETTDGKVDGIIVDIAAVKAVVDSIDLQINPGGYILN